MNMDSAGKGGDMSKSRLRQKNLPFFILKQNQKTQKMQLNDSFDSLF